MDGRVSDPIVIKIDADIEDARRKLAQLEKEAERSAGKIQRSFLNISAAAGQGSAQGRAGNRSLAGVPARQGPGDKIRITTSRPTGENFDASIARLAGIGLAGAGGGMFAIPGGQVPGAAVGALGAGTLFMAELAERSEKFVSRVFTLNEALETFRQNQKNANQAVEEARSGLVDSGGAIRDTSELLKRYNDALGENRAIIGGIVTARDIFQRQIADLKRSNDGVLGDAPRAQDALRNLQATEEALRNIGAIVKDPATQEFLRLFRQGDGLGRPLPDDRISARSDFLGRALPDERIDPRPLKSRFLDLGGGAGRDRLDRGLADVGGRVEDLSAGFLELTEAAGGFEAQGGALVAFLTQSNALLGEQSGLLGQLSAQAPVLGGELAALFEDGAEAGRVFSEVADAVGASLLDAFEGAIARGESLSDVLKGLAIDMAEIVLKSAGNALLGSILGGLFGGLAGGIGGGRAATAGTSIPGGIGGFAKGGAFARDETMARNLKAFARGGIVDTPEAFAFANGLGIMGEAGPEAILPLARARSGELGVRAMIGNRSAAGGSAPAAAGPTFNIDARGADREGMRELLRFIQFVDGKVNQVDRSIEPRALRAWANHRRRGGFR